MRGHVTCVDSLDDTISQQHLPVQLADHVLSDQGAVAAAGQVLQAPDNEPGEASAKADVCKDKSNKELSQGENVRSGRPQEEASSTGTGVAGEAAGSLRSVAAAPAASTNAEPAASALVAAPAQELLTPAKQEEAKAPASPASKRPSLFRRVLRTLRRAFCTSSRATHKSKQ